MQASKTAAGSSGSTSREWLMGSLRPSDSIGALFIAVVMAFPRCLAGPNREKPYHARYVPASQWDFPAYFEF